MADYVIQQREKWWHDRNARWRHNGFFGSVRMASMNMQGIAEAPTTTKEAKDIAINIQRLLSELKTALQTRIDQKDDLSVDR